jgi:hypothetical protein
LKFVWKKFWLLFTVIWVVVSGLSAFTIVAFGEEIEREKAIQPIFLGVAVPAVLYLIGLLWEHWKRKHNSGSGS